MGKTSYQNINELIKDLSDHLEKLNSGKLSLPEIEDAVNNAKEIYERLVVVRFKAYENFGKPETQVVEAISAQPKIETPEVKPFDFTAIEDESAKKISEPKIVKPSLPDIGFDFSEDAFESPKIEKQAEPVVTIEIKKTIETIRAETKAEISASVNEKFQRLDEKPLNEKLKQEDDLPLRKKLQVKAIADYRTEIGIGKKFEYINFLFGGNTKAYEAGIDALNACQSSEEAKQILHEFGATYHWNFEEKTIIKFIELVERKFV